MRALKITNTITSRDEKSLEKYFNEISRYDVLAPEEELEAFRLYKSGNEEALIKIVRHNLRFVVSVAKQYQHMGLHLGDLINEGNLGLIKAAQRFDETKGFKFISYAVWWIRQSILQAINEKGRKIRLPLNFTSTSNKVRQKTMEILQHQEREPTLDELAIETGLPEKTIQKCIDSYKKCSSLDAPLNNEDDTSKANFISDNSIPQPDHEMAEKESTAIKVRELLNILPPRQAKVISMYFGIGHKNPMSLTSIAETVGVSRERARQIRDKGLVKLRSYTKRESVMVF
ncbi:MAG: RNA polymerase subunit sigma [Bacteroidetes bacterium]|nr:MAG: RNA polymerase subunit sigma [Bacteroidota bacterium]